MACFVPQLFLYLFSFFTCFDPLESIERTLFADVWVNINKEIKQRILNKRLLGGQFIFPALLEGPTVQMPLEI